MSEPPAPADRWDSEKIERQLKLLRRAGDLCEQGSGPADLFHRSVELLIRAGTLASTPFNDPAYNSTAARMATLLDPPGVIDPDSPEMCLRIAGSLALMTAPSLGVSAGGWGNHLKRDCVEISVGYLLKSARLQRAGV